MVELRILGSLQLSAADGRHVETLVRHPKRTALLAYLAAAQPRGHHRRDTLLALFWPESDAARARAALNQALYVLRSTLGEQALVPRSDGEVGLNHELVWCDATAFEAALDSGRSGDALDLYRGNLLEGFFVTGAPEFERWLERERARLRERAAEGAWALAEARAAARDPVEAERWARRAAELAPADEAVARRLMTFLNNLGDRAAAIRAYEAYVAKLAGEYELEPSAETRALAAAIRREERPAASVLPDKPVLASPPALPGAAGRRWISSRRALAGSLVASALAAAVWLGVATHQRSIRGAPSGVPRVLVLPFQNLGAPGDAYFAEGITDEITARLAMVKGLKVIGGQAAARYKGTNKSPRQVGEELGVEYVLEGTVSWQRTRSGPGRVRVRPALINARDETQVWAAVLDQDANMSELFRILSGITQRVVDELHVALGPRQRPGLSDIPTKSLDAYDYYLRGRTFAHGTWSAKSNLAAIQMFERAVERDSGFALAYARLAFSHTEAFWLNDLSPAHLDSAKVAVERALALDPSLPEAHVALGHYYEACCGDYERALRHLETAYATRPSDAVVVMLIGNVHKRHGEWDEAIQFYERAASLDPGWDPPLLNLGVVQLWLHRYDEAEQTSRRALSLEPREAFAYTILASVPLLRDGDIATARRLVLEAAVSDAYEGMRLPFYIELWDHNYQTALARTRGGEPAGWFWEDWLVNDHVRRALTLRLLGDSSKARVHFDSARAQLEMQLPRAARRQVHNSIESALAITYAGLGRRGEAIELATRLVASNPRGVDALDGPSVLENLALAYVLAGERRSALDLIERVLSMPACFSPQLLRLDPLWDPLRGDPRFERLARGR